MERWCGDSVCKERASAGMSHTGTWDHGSFFTRSLALRTIHLRAAFPFGPIRAEKSPRWIPTGEYGLDLPYRCIVSSPVSYARSRVCTIATPEWMLDTPQVRLFGYGVMQTVFLIRVA